MSVNNFAALQIGLASPQRIREWSYGEVTKPETINYRSQKPERDGLFCERIFGPSKDWECHCGKYKKVRYKGVICDKCGVEITKSSVRRERMGHIELAAPVAHIWYLRGIPSRMSLLLDVPPKQLEEVVYFVSWIVTDPGTTDLAYKEVLSESQYRALLQDPKVGPHSFTAQTGAEAVQTLLAQVDVEKEYKNITEDLKNASGEKRKKLIKRLETVNAFRTSSNQPEWMVLNVLPVIPPDLRPMLQLDGGRFATSDLNDLYRRVITRNNRLKKLLEIGTPAIIVQNEKRMLQEAVDALIDNGRRSKPMTGAGGRALKSLSHSLKGKQGRFRQNLLGKRVDFSGRSVIAVGPDLKMFQCGIPREMAISLYKPFVINEIVNQGIVGNPKAAEKLIEKLDPRVWDIVEQVIDGHPVLLNRAPTLHRLGIQAFQPKLVEGRAIRLHPLVTTAFNADFDGDQMAVHLPLSEMARAEAQILMLGSHNILGPKDGKPIVTPSQDMILGNYYLTMEETAEEFLVNADRLESFGDTDAGVMWRTFAENEGHVYRDLNEVLMAYDTHQVHLHSRVALLGSSLKKTCFTEEQNNSYLITTVGKLIFNDMFPADFPYLNEATKRNFAGTPDDFFVKRGVNVKEYVASLPVKKAFVKKDIGNVINEVFKRYKNSEQTSRILDDLKDNGFKYSTVAGMTVSLADIKVHPSKYEFVAKGKEDAAKITRMKQKGLLTTQEWERHFSKVWENAKENIVTEFMGSLARKNPIMMMSDSGARGNRSHFTQLAGMRGLMARPTQSKGNKEYQVGIIEVPIYSSFREGLSVSEFFISTHGVRKGLTDTALKTAESGYLTRRLADVAQDVVITEEDCGTDRGYYATTIVDAKTNAVIEKLEERLIGRFSKQQVFDPATGEMIIDSDEMIDELTAAKIAATIPEEDQKKGVGIYIRNVFTCDSQTGICRKCYGRHMATGAYVESGEVVGIMAAQSIGEPGTQLTMRTFHTGGVASGESGDITQGLPRVEELFEARNPKHPAVISKIDGKVTEIRELENHGGFRIVVENDKEAIEHKADASHNIRSWIKEGTTVKAGEKLTEGQVSPKELLEVAGVLAVQNYILKEVKRVYQSQGIEISDKHIEVMIRQMLRKVVIINGNDAELSAGQQISINKLNKINNKILMEGKTAATFAPVLLGISKASVETDSFLSAASFQETTKVLTDAAIHEKVDELRGLKENDIMGKIIPAGTGTTYERETTKQIRALAEELRQKRIERNKQNEEEEEVVESSELKLDGFTKLMDAVDSIDEELEDFDEEFDDELDLDLEIDEVSEDEEVEE
ncbi:MAG: DNA-directed RNA polymerase subunit beta' [Erysipelotrichaceae bacterium]|nr:DNA-directed RNA polymerase subunit beta' [Erysipelotrichaceae bacterium]